MELNIISDLHIEFGEYKHIATAENVIICGDISGDADKSLEWIKENYKEQKCRIFWIYGNHEFYRHKTFQTSVDYIKKKIEQDKYLWEHVILLDNNILEWEGVTFIGSTLWTDFSKNIINKIAAGEGMNDYKYIKSSKDGKNYGKLRPDTTEDKFYENLRYIEDNIKDKKKVVIITHHGPSYRSVPNMFKTSRLNSAYVTDLEEFIENNQQIKLWCHGHTHTNFDYKIGETRIICNPRGYKSSDENEEYDENLIVDL